jgi:hypothetical protein
MRYGPAGCTPHTPHTSAAARHGATVARTVRRTSSTPPPATEMPTLITLAAFISCSLSRICAAHERQAWHGRLLPRLPDTHLAAPRLQKARKRHLHIRPLARWCEQERLPEVVRGALPQRSASTSQQAADSVAFATHGQRYPVVGAQRGDVLAPVALQAQGAATKPSAWLTDARSGQPRTRTRNSSVSNASKSSSSSPCRKLQRQQAHRKRCTAAATHGTPTHVRAHAAEAAAAKHAHPASRSCCVRYVRGQVPVQRGILAWRAAGRSNLGLAAAHSSFACLRPRQPYKRTLRRELQRGRRHAAVLAVGKRLCTRASGLQRAGAHCCGRTPPRLPQRDVRLGFEGVQRALDRRSTVLNCRRQRGSRARSGCSNRAAGKRSHAPRSRRCARRTFLRVVFGTGQRTPPQRTLPHGSRRGGQAGMCVPLPVSCASACQRRRRVRVHSAPRGWRARLWVCGGRRRVGLGMMACAGDRGAVTRVRGASALEDAPARRGPRVRRRRIDSRARPSSIRRSGSSRPRTRHPRPAPPRCAAAGYTWPGAPSGRARPS